MTETFKDTMTRNKYTFLGNGYYAKLAKEFPFHLYIAWEDHMSGEWSEAELSVENTVELLKVIKDTEK